jgi:hypothetical protein
MNKDGFSLSIIGEILLAVIIIGAKVTDDNYGERPLTGRPEFADVKQHCT